MGSEKKRKRSSTDPPTGEMAAALAKAERKRLKKARREAIENHEALVDSGVSKNEIAPLVSPVASPLAGKKLTKKLFKLVGHAAKEKALRRGIKEVVLALRKSDHGIVILASNVFPVDVIAHLPVICEEADVPYCYVSTKLDLGNAALTKRPTSVVLVSETRAKGEVKAELEDLKQEVKAIQNLY